MMTVTDHIGVVNSIIFPWVLSFISKCLIHCLLISKHQISMSATASRAEMEDCALTMVTTDMYVNVPLDIPGLTVKRVRIALYSF